MAKQEQLQKLLEVEEAENLRHDWNLWRAKNPKIEIDLSNADLQNLDERQIVYPNFTSYLKAMVVGIEDICEESDEWDLLFSATNTWLGYPWKFKASD